MARVPAISNKTSSLKPRDAIILFLCGLRWRLAFDIHVRMSIRHSVLATLLLTAGLFRVLAEQPTAPATVPELRQRLSEIISQPKYSAAFWGVKIVSLDSGSTLFEHHAQKLFSPASNSKLYTVALALDRLGADYKIRTSLYSPAKPNHRGTLAGDLIIYGRGDPTLNARLHGGDMLQALEPLVGALTNAGVRRIDGDLVGDASFFRGSALGSGWDWDDTEYSYGAEISALTINDNVLPITVVPGQRVGDCCRVTVGFGGSYLLVTNRTQTVEPGQRPRLSFFRPLNENVLYVSGQVPTNAPTREEDIPVHKPAALFVCLFKQALAAHGIVVRGRVRTVDWQDRQGVPFNPDTCVELASVESPPMRELAREVEKPSQNLYADLLLSQVGENARSVATPPETTSEDLGLEELNRFLAEAGVRKGDVWFDEGSGLSRNNLTTPEATVCLLRYMSHHQCAADYLNALPIAGVDGTLRNRMKGTAAAGNVRAKTGSLRWASSLSGYVTSAAGERLAFSLMLNRYHGAPGTSGRGDLDNIAVLLAGFTGKSTSP